MRRVKPWIQQTAVGLIFTHLLLFLGHVEWWQPDLGHHLNLPLLIYLIVSTVGLSYLVDPDDPCWDDETEERKG